MHAVEKQLFGSKSVEVDMLKNGPFHCTFMEPNHPNVLGMQSKAATPPTFLLDVVRESGPINVHSVIPSHFSPSAVKSTSYLGQ